MGKKRGSILCFSMLILLGCGCGPRYQSVETLEQGMEYYAKERYAYALRCMEASRFELAREQFELVQKTAVTPELQQLARDGYAKVAAVIEARRR